MLSLHLNESEGANFWLEILTDLQNRGVKDILITCTDNLKIFFEAIQSIFPQTEIQSCIVQQIRNSLQYISTRDRKEFVQDLKKTYKAQTKEAAEEELLFLSEK
ncbi:MAG: transposase [Bacteroidota bacterium]